MVKLAVIDFDNTLMNGETLEYLSILLDSDIKHIMNNSITESMSNVSSDLYENITNNIITTDTETLNYSFSSEKFNNFSKINFKGNYDLKEDSNKEYSLGYSYFDECFGINLDFERKFYSDNNLKPQDTLTIMFSFKNVGSYKSTNLAVSENDKQDIEWENLDINNELFN